MRVRACAFFPVALLAVGCTAGIVVLRDVPEKPSFTVIPANNYMSEVAFSNAVEMAIVRAGVAVIQRPGAREVVTLQEAGGTALDGMLLERYIALDEIRSDYVAYSYARSRQIRIVRVESGEVIAVVGVTSQSAADVQTAVRRALIGLEIVKR